MIVLSRLLGKWWKDLKQTVSLRITSFTVSGDIKKKKKISENIKKKKKSSENDQLTGIFRAFLIVFILSPDPKSEKKNPVNQLIRKIWPQ